MNHLSLPAPIEVNLERSLTNGLLVDDRGPLDDLGVFLQQIADALREADTTTPVTLRRGTRADVVASAGRTSFVIFPTTDDGLSPTLIEAMGAGCIPVAYRPPSRVSRRSVNPESFANTFRRNAGVIRHRKNGFLVEHGSLAGLVQTILFLQKMTPEQVLSLRRRAMATAHKVAIRLG